MDPRERDFTLSRAGMIHATAAFVAMLAICIAAPVLSRTLVSLAPASSPWTALASWMPLSGTMVFALSVAARRPLSILTGRVSLHGLGERIGFGGFTAWPLYASSVLLAAAPQ
jgi:hypothetical protein